MTQLTSRLQLGAENVIARIAFTYSMASERQLDLLQIEDSQGKEYSSKVLFGDHADIYIAMVCVHYQLYKTDKDIARYVKMHIDDGLQLIANEIKRNDNINGSDFLISKIERGLRGLN
ncbi:MAG: DndE family protein [Chitinophagaceae bacterium]|nr:DndE family protein [Chitinophagaceae bacterium]